MGLLKKWQVENSSTLELANNLAEVKDSSITTAKLAFGTWQKIAEIEVTSDTNQVNITGLDGDNDKVYCVIARIVNADTSGNRTFYFRFNDDTATNYTMQRLRGEYSSSIINQGDATFTAFAEATAGQVVGATSFIYAQSGQNRTVIAYSGCGNGVSVFSGRWNNSTDNITKINIVAEGTYIGAGSKFILLKLSS